ncbi:MAG: VOC family protein [Dermatophilaceae bacterium]|nr:VOC family protein [Actinomycetales bacterium]
MAATFKMVEFPTSSAGASAEFFQRVFGWRGTAYGPDYQDVPMGDGVSLGFQADTSEAPAQPLVVIEVDDLASVRAEILASGGVVTVEPFSFPGGSRMHFREPGGSELAVYVPEDE